MIMPLFAVTDPLEWVAPGTATAAVLLTVWIFLKQMKSMQVRQDKKDAAAEARLVQITTSFQNQVDRLIAQQNVNEDRRMGQIEKLFDKFMVLSGQSIATMVELKEAFSALTQEVRNMKKE